MALNVPTISHVTQAQAARILKKSKQTIGRNSLRGLLLEAEKVVGTYMIPTERVKTYAFIHNIQIDPKIMELL